jgi:hypothetical protein
MVCGQTFLPVFRFLLGVKIVRVRKYSTVFKKKINFYEKSGQLVRDQTNIFVLMKKKWW